MKKILYIVLDPFGGPDLKIGKTGLFAARLGNYQNSYSSRSYVANFAEVWVGDGLAIDRLESVLKKEFDWEIELDGRGHSEWMYDVSKSDVIKKIEKIIKDYKFKVERVSKKYLPLNIHNMDQFTDSYLTKKEDANEL